MQSIGNHNPNERRDTSRADVAIEASVRRTGRTPFTVLVNDLSPTGCRAETLSKMMVDDHILITLPGFAPIAGTVRWVVRTQFGVQWASPMHASVFDHIRRQFPDIFR